MTKLYRKEPNNKAYSKVFAKSKSVNNFHGTDKTLLFLIFENNMNYYIYTKNEKLRVTILIEGNKLCEYFI